MPRLAVALAAFALSCNDECESRRCEPVDAGAEPSDIRLEFQTDSSFVKFEIEGHAADQPLIGGEMAIHVEDPRCVASPSTPCRLTLRHLRLELVSAHLDTSDGSVFLQAPRLSVQAPLELVDSGFGFVIPTGTVIQTCLRAGGQGDSARVPLAVPATFNRDPDSGAISLEGLFPVRFHAGNDSCETFDASANIITSATPR